MGEWRTRAWGVEALEARTMLSASAQHAVAPLLKTVSHSLSVPTTSNARIVAKSVVAQASSSKPVFHVKPVAPKKRVLGKLPKVAPKTAAKPVVASPAPPPAGDEPILPGDVNGDGRVDTLDFKIVNDHIGQSGMGLAEGDLNGDGKVTMADFQLVEVNFGKVLPRYHYATVGINLDGIADFATIGAFVDLARMFRQWGTVTKPYEPDPSIPRTADNYPLADAGAMTYARTYPDGVYKVSWDGNADLSFEGMGAAMTVTSHEGDHWTADLALDHHAGEILNLYLKNIDQNDPLHNLHIISPDVDYSISDTFRPVFLQKLAPFNGPLRMMDWMQTNWNPAVNWSDRTRPETFSNANSTGVDYESIVKLANLLHRDLWINVPYHANDDYVRQMADLFRDQLDPSLKLDVEFSNEVWNSGTFGQALENTQIAKDDPDLDRTDDFGRSAQEAGKQMGRVSSIFREEFGDAQFADRVRPVFGGFIATTYWAQTALDYIADHYGPVKDYVSAIAVAPYVGVEGDMSDIDKAGLTADTLFDWMNNFIDNRLGPWIQQAKVLANYYRVPLWAYEGGQSLQATNGMNEALKQAAQDDPRMGEVYQHLIRTWYDTSGGGIFENFALATPPTAFGYWGVLTSIDQPTSVKWEAVLSTIEGLV